MIGGYRGFTPLQRLLHWLMAACVLAMLFIGVGMVSTVMPKYLTLVSIHKPLGIAILVLALIRLALRLRYGAPPLPADLPEPMKLAAQSSHYFLYALMIGMPLIGWGMLSAAAYSVVLFGGWHLPANPPPGRIFQNGPPSPDAWPLRSRPRSAASRARPRSSPRRTPIASRHLPRR